MLAAPGARADLKEAPVSFDTLPWPAVIVSIVVILVGGALGWPFVRDRRFRAAPPSQPRPSSATST